MPSVENGGASAQAVQNVIGKLQSHLTGKKLPAIRAVQQLGDSLVYMPRQRRLIDQHRT